MFYSFIASDEGRSWRSERSWRNGEFCALFSKSNVTWLIGEVDDEVPDKATNKLWVTCLIPLTAAWTFKIPVKLRSASFVATATSARYSEGAEELMMMRRVYR
jgi:hypothetical protein